MDDDEDIEIILEIRRRPPDFMTGTFVCGYCDKQFQVTDERTLYEMSWVHPWCALEIMTTIMKGGTVRLRENIAEAEGEVQ